MDALSFLVVVLGAFLLIVPPILLTWNWIHEGDGDE